MTDAISRNAVHVVINSRVFDTEYPSEFDELPRMVNEIPAIKIDGNTSDGYHTFNELYDHRAKLFSVIVRDHSELCWKSKLHHDGTMYDGMFIVGINTPHGQASYHYDIDPYWDLFQCKEMERAPEWDRHTPEEAINRIAAINVVPVVHARWIYSGCVDADGNCETNCSCCGAGDKHRADLKDAVPFCWKCGARMDGDENETD